MFARTLWKIHICTLRNFSSYCRTPPKHLICFKQWTADMVKEIITSAVALKKKLQDTHCKKLDILNDCKITILLEVNQPLLALAVSKAASLLGAQDNIVVDKLIWDQDYFGKVFSYMSDAIFVSTATHMCLQRFADQSEVPVLCMVSRTHATIQSMATIMAIYEEYGCLNKLNVSYVGPPRPILNSYLLLCPMLDANIKYKCCCRNAPLSPLLYKASEHLCEVHKTDLKSCTSQDELLKDCNVVIAGPTPNNKDKISTFKLELQEIMESSEKWIFFHTCPRGEEVDDDLFCHENSRTFVAFENMQYVAASLMASCIKGHNFSCS